MEITMDRAGRLVIPSEIRKEAAIEPGTPLDIRLRDGVIEIQPKTLPVKIEREGHLFVARPLVPVPPMSEELVERTRQQIQGQRLRQHLRRKRTRR